MLGAAGCDRRPQGVEEAGAAAKVAALLKKAPPDFPEFLAWAEPLLQEMPEATAIPPARLPPQQWRVIRLDDEDRLVNARITSSWTPDPQAGAALASAGPYRTDQPATLGGRRIVRNATAAGEDAMEFLAGGFRVERGEVGSMLFSMQVPFGRHITVSWSRAGEITIPVPTNEEAFPVRVLTDGLAEWEGPLEQLQFRTDGVGSGPVVVEQVMFLPRASTYVEAFGRSRVRLGHEIRSAIYMHAPAELTFSNVVLPASARLHVGLGHVANESRAGEADDETAVTKFEVIIEHEGECTVVLEHTLQGAAGWADGSAALDSWAGKTVSLTLKAGSSAADTVAFWGNPVLYEPQEDAPVTVLYLIDTVCAEHLELYGAARATMPRLTALSQRGVVFRNAISNSSRTIESIPDMMLSMPTERHGVHHNSTSAPTGLVTLAEAMRAAGFATISMCTNVNAGPRQGMDRGFDTFIDKIGYFWTDYDRTVPLEEAQAWLDAHRGRPMFLYVHTAEPHAPYTPPEGFRGHFDPDYDGRIDGTYSRETGFRNITDPVAQRRDLEHVMALYDEEILYSDHRFGLFLDALDERGLLDRAHVFVVSDHGEEFLQHGMWEHGLNLHNEQTRVPFVAVGPGIPAGLHLEPYVQLMDVMPTILELYDLAQPYELFGHSLLPLLRDPSGGDAAARRADVVGRDLFLSNHNYRISHKLIEFGVISDQRWKLLYGWRPWRVAGSNEGTRFTLFDVSADLHERRNLVFEQPEIARRLVEKLLAWRLANPPYDPGRDAGQYDVTPDEIRHLQQMGYVGGRTEEP